MKNLNCPQCDIHRFQVKNALNESVVVTVNEHCDVVPVHKSDSLEGFDLDVIYCLGCSWYGSPKSLKNGKHRRV